MSFILSQLSEVESPKYYVLYVFCALVMHVCLIFLYWMKILIFKDKATGGFLH